MVDMLSMFILQISKKDNNLHTNKAWILECNFVTSFFFYVYCLQCLFLLSYFLDYVVSFFLVSEISNALMIIFLNVFLNFFCGWFIILQMFSNMWCTIQELIIVFRWLIRQRQGERIIEIGKVFVAPFFLLMSKVFVILN